MGTLKYCCCTHVLPELFKTDSNRYVSLFEGKTALDKNFTHFCIQFYLLLQDLFSFVLIWFGLVLVWFGLGFGWFGLVWFLVCKHVLWNRRV